MTHAGECGSSVPAALMNGLALFATLLVLQGCASMDREQCQLADWRLVGYQDGVLGKTAATIGDYSRDCAGHAVVPDLDAWRAGRDEGLLEYCTNDNGFRLGQAGRGYNGVCPDTSETAFRNAYEAGRAIYLARLQVSSTHSKIYKRRYEIDALEEDKHDKLSALVQNGLRSEQRVLLLYEIHEIETEIDMVGREIIDLERDLALQQAHLDQLTQ
jgi:hypothetical protein